MYYSNNNYPNRYSYNNNNDRFLLPFLGGALIGGAAVGLTRPRPIYNVAPNQGRYNNFNPNMPYGNYSYSYYYPTYYRPY